MGFFSGLFDSGEKDLVTHQQTRRYGEAEAGALQPGMFNAWRDIMGSGGVPYAADLDAFTKDAYARAAKAAGVTAPGAAGAAIGSDIGKRGGIAGDLLMGATGIAGRQNLTNMAGQAAGYIGDLTSDRTQYGFLGGYDLPSDWDRFWGGINTLTSTSQLLDPILGTQLPNTGGVTGTGGSTAVGSSVGSSETSGLWGSAAEDAANTAGGLDASRTNSLFGSTGESYANLAGEAGLAGGGGFTEFLKMLPFF